MKKIALIITVVMIVSLVTSGFNVFAASRDAYDGWALVNFDATTNKSVTTSGVLGNEPGNNIYTYHNVNFGDIGPSSVTVTYDAGQGGGLVNLYLDSQNSAPFASFTFNGTGWGNVMTATAEISNTITGVHTVYLKTGTSYSNYRDISFKEKVLKENSYSDYNVDDSAFSDVIGESYQNDINFFYEMGFSGRDHEKNPLYYANMPVSRGRFLYAVSRLTIQEPPAVEDTGFADVPANHEFAADIAYAKALGYVNGYGDGNFGPDEFITLQEAYTIACRALKLPVSVDNASGYTIAARRYKLDSGIPEIDYLKEYMMARLIKNMVYAPYYDVTGVNSDGQVNYEVNNDGIMSLRGIYYGTGQVRMNNITHVSVADSAFSDNRVAIGDEIFFAGTTSARVMIGFECEYYYSSNDAGVATLLYLGPVEGVKVQDFYSNKVDGIKVTVDEFSYIDEKEKERSIFLDGVRILYNGVAIDDAPEKLMTDDFKGRIRYVENPNEDDVLLIDGYRNIIIGSVDRKTNFIYDDVSGEKLNYTADKYFAYLTKDNEIISMANVVPGDAAMVYESKNTTGMKLVRIAVSNKSVTGQITATSDEKVIINDIEYDVAVECPKSVYLGLNAKFVVNDYNEIVDYAEVAVAADNIAYLFDTTNFAEVGRYSREQIKVLDQDNAVRVYTLAESCMVDGVRYRNGEAKIPSAAKNAPVRYRLNDRKEVTFIDTLAKGAENENDGMELIHAASKALYYLKGQKVFTDDGEGYNKFRLAQTDNIKLIQGPDNGEEDDYQWLVFSSFSEGEARYYGGYSTGTNGEGADIIYYKREIGRSDYAEMFAVTGHGTSLDEEGNIVDVIHGFSGKGDVSYIYTDRDDTLKAQLDALRPGDWVTVSTKANGEVAGLIIGYLYDGVEALNYGVDKTIAPSIYDGVGLASVNGWQKINWRLAAGRVVSRDGDFIEIVHDGSGVYEYINIGSGISAVTAEIDDSGNVKVFNKIPSESIAVGDELVLDIQKAGVRSIYIKN